MRRGSVALLVVLTMFVPAAVGSAQRVSAGVALSHVDHRVADGAAPELSSGVLAGAEVRVALWRRLSVTVGAAGGQLETSTAGAFERDVAQLSGAVALEAVRWLVFDAGLTVRSYSTVVARQRWTLGRLGAEARVPLSGDRLHAVGGVGLLPVVSVSGLPGADLAFEAGVGLEYRRGRLALGLRYDLERYDFPTAGPGDRNEQLSALTLRLVWGR